MVSMGPTLAIATGPVTGVTRIRNDRINATRVT
jgi:hypothetical protein